MKVINGLNQSQSSKCFKLRLHEITRNNLPCLVHEVYFSGLVLPRKILLHSNILERFDSPPGNDVWLPHEGHYLTNCLFVHVQFRLFCGNTAFRLLIFCPPNEFCTQFHLFLIDFRSIKCIRLKEHGYCGRITLIVLSLNGFLL